MLNVKQRISWKVVTVSLPGRESYFNDLNDYDIENEFIKTKRKLESLLDKKNFKRFWKVINIKAFNTTEPISCQYFDEDQFISKIKKRIPWYFYTEYTKPAKPWVRTMLKCK